MVNLLKISKTSNDKHEVDLSSYSSVLRFLNAKTKPSFANLVKKTFKIKFDQLVLQQHKDPAPEALKYIVNKFFNQKNKSIDIPRFAQVDKNLFRGGAPTVSQISELAKLGIKRIVSLDFDVARRIQDACADNGIQHIVFPITARNLKTAHHLCNVDWTSLLSKIPTYIHCWHGKDRTGLVVALYKRQQGCGADEAIKDADTFGFCTGLPDAVRKFYTALIKSVDQVKDNNSAMEMMWPDSLADYKFDGTYLPNDPSFALSLTDDASANPVSRLADPFDVSYFGNNQGDHAEPTIHIPYVGMMDNTTYLNQAIPSGVTDNIVPGVGTGVL